jgi:hypothetical protein
MNWAFRPVVVSQQLPVHHCDKHHQPNHNLAQSISHRREPPQASPLNENARPMLVRPRLCLSHPAQMMHLDPNWNVNESHIQLNQAVASSTPKQQISTPLLIDPVGQIPLPAPKTPPNVSAAVRQGINVRKVMPAARMSTSHRHFHPPNVIAARSSRATVTLRPTISI